MERSEWSAPTSQRRFSSAVDFLAHGREDSLQDHRQLRVWNDAQNLCVDVYALSADFPVEERYGLTAQIRKAAVSVGSNIAESSRRTSRTDKARILNVAESEAAEVMSELDIASRLQFVGKKAGQALIDRYDRLLGSLERLRQRVLEGDVT